MKLFIEANDVLMFRDGRPFSGGEDHFARTVFPPGPSTFYGALRSKILSEKWEDYEKFIYGQSEELLKEIGTPDKNGTLKIEAFGLASRKKENLLIPYFPVPRDVVGVKGKGESPLLLLKPEYDLRNMTKTSLHDALSPLWVRTKESIQNVTGFLSLMEMEKYLNGETPEEIIKQESLFRFEERTGIRKNRTSRSVDIEKGGLYSVEYVRLQQDVGFFLEVSGTDLLPVSGLLRLGGDHRTARYGKASWELPSLEEVKKKISETKRFKLILTTPAIFSKGWLPGGIDESTLKGTINGVPVRLMAAATDRPAGMGGFDLVKGKPKAMVRVVPAGSVYFFEVLNSNIDELIKKLWWQSISDERSQEGFGIGLIGSWS